MPKASLIATMTWFASLPELAKTAETVSPPREWCCHYNQGRARHIVAKTRLTQFEAFPLEHMSFNMHVPAICLKKSPPFVGLFFYLTLSIILGKAV